jgi:Tol biopolymer transport system component/DNA-binding winged helix-turn-helix (wHTH) protein
MASSDTRREEVFLKLAHASGKPSLLSFGGFTLDLQRHGLYLRDRRIHLTSKPFETLVVLVEHRGKTVEKQKLLDAVWKDAFVTEDSLVKAVREIRRALDDEKSSPRFIQTVPGEGYRFIAEVTPATSSREDQPDPGREVVTSVSADAASGEQAAVKEPNVRHESVVLPSPMNGPRIRLWTRRAALILLAILAIGMLWRPWRKSESSAQRLIWTVVAQRTSASFSPDGNWITFIGDVDGVPQVWIKSLVGGEPVPITSGDIPASHPRWSPKNSEIVFNRGGESQSIWSVPSLGGLAPTLLIEGGRNASWSSDGNRLVFETGGEIRTADADGTNQQRVDGIPQINSLIVDREPSFSPDGSEIAFFQPEDGPMGDIWVIPSRGGRAKQLTFDNHLGGGPVWTPDGGQIVFTSQRGGSKTLWKIHRSGGVPEPVLKGPGEDTDPAISPDGSRVIYTSTRNHWILTIRDEASGRTEELRETRTDMFFPSFSPQGDKLAFFATVDEGDIQLFTVRADGKELTQVTRARGERNTFPSWSSDGSTLYFYQVRPRLSFRRISAAGGTSFEIAPGWRWRTHNAAQVDPGGKRVVYSTVEKGKVAATLVREIETGEEIVFHRTLDGARWAQDGKLIVGVDLTSARPDSVFGDIAVCSVESGACRTVATRGAGPIWSGDGSRIYFERWKSIDSREVWAVSTDGENEKLIVERRHVDPIAAFFDVSKTGQVVYVQFKQGQHELWMTDFQ